MPSSIKHPEPGFRTFHPLCGPGDTFIGKVQNWRPIAARAHARLSDTQPSIGMAGKKKSLESDCMIKHLYDIGVKFS